MAIEFGGSGDDCRANIHGRTSRFTKTIYDPYVNMLRSTTEAFAGVAGGLDSLHAGTFAEPVRRGNEFSRRSARNTQIILQQECTLMQPVDPAGGSWYVETLTVDLARKAWDMFRQVERLGGMLKALQAGFPQSQAEKTALKRAENAAKRRDVIVGANMYANLTEKPLAPDGSLRANMRQAQMEQMKLYRKAADTAESWRW